MYKIVDLTATLNIFKEVFNKRLKESKFYSLDKTYKIVTEIGTAALIIKRGRVEITKNIEEANEVKIPIKILTSILTGYKDISCFKAQLDINEITDFEIFKVLFPLENPYIWDLEYSD